MAKIKLDSNLLERAKRVAQSAGYSSVEEFVAHCIENELQKHEAEEAEKQVADQLRGLGYLE
jgi:metal-responsive CopG/Arc/MetJ family transcriptional regulator